MHAAPLLCAALIGLRTLRAGGDPARVGIYGFGNAAHLICQIAVWEGREVYAFTRPQVTTYALEDAQQALDDLRSGALEGAAVIVP